MRPRRGLRATLGLLGVALVVGAAAVPAGAAALRRQEPGAATDGAEDPFDRLADCVVETGHLLVVLLVDESASLLETDPDDQRVVAARTALQSLDRLRGTDAEGGEVRIDVLVSTFSNELAPVGDWATLDETTSPQIDASIADLAARDASMDTDFYNALDGARSSLEAQAGTADGDVCKAVLLFTDGTFALGARETAEQRERFGTTKPYAPGVELTDDAAVAEATTAGIDALCAPGGAADQLRDADITLVSVALGGGADLLEAMTTGTAASGETCGDPATSVPGVYLAVENTDDLLATFDLVASRIAGGDLDAQVDSVVPCPEGICDEGAVAFTVDSSLRGVHILASGPSADTAVVLEPPEGAPLEIAPGEDVDTSVGGAAITATWVADRTATIDLVVPEGGDADGAWRALVGSDGDGRGRLQVVTLERGVDEAKRLALAAGLMIGGLLAPLALLLVINRVTTRFQDLEDVSAARVHVAVTSGGRVVRTDGSRDALHLEPGDFESLAGQGGSRQFSWRGLVFLARTPLNPFAEPCATVAPEEGTAHVARSARRADIDLGLAGSWMFLLDQDATRATVRPGEIQGELVAFVAADSGTVQTARLVTDVEERMPSTARHLADVAGVRSAGLSRAPVR